MKMTSNRVVIDASVLRRDVQPQQSLQRRAMQITTLSAASLRSHQEQQYVRDLYEFKVERSNGLPVSLSCTDSVRASNDSSISSNTKNKTSDTRQILDTTILFDYELTLRDPMEEIVEVLRQDLPKWEFFLLYYVAEEIGIIGCQQIGQQNITSSSQSNSSSVDVINISSFGSDVVDTRVASCEFLVNLEPGYICVPLKGTMTAVFVGYESDRSAVESFLAYHVATVVNNSDFFGAGVNQTAFIGSRVVPSPAPIVDSTIDETKSIDGDNSTVDVTVAVASTLSVAAVFFMFLIYFVMARRGPRRSSNSNADITDDPQSDILSKQVPIGGADDVSYETMRQPQHVNTNPTQSSIDSISEKSDDARCGSLDSANRLGHEVIAPSINTPYSLSNTRTVSTVVSTDDSDVYIEDDETAKVSNIYLTEEVAMNTVATSSNETQGAMPVALPPKHPTGPSSKTLLVPFVAAAKPPKSQRRRKKKKKKVATIIRSNSRENIKEMETITEVEEETSGDNNDLHDASDDDEDGSWCSTSDSDPGSRDPSPARSSRDPSPARSTGSAGKDRAATSAAPDTAKWDTTTSIGPSPDRTIGTDKPKPKKIPPAWI